MTVSSLARMGQRGEGKASFKGKGKKKYGRGRGKLPRQTWAFLRFCLLCVTETSHRRILACFLKKKTADELLLYSRNQWVPHLVTR